VFEEQRKHTISMLHQVNTIWATILIDLIISMLHRVNTIWATILSDIWATILIDPIEENILDEFWHF
jgi:hypothetical protein